MLNKLWNSVQGYKTHLVAWGSLAIVLLGHFAGPIHIGSFTLPQFSMDDVFNQLKQSSLFSALRAGVSQIGGSK